MHFQLKIFIYIQLFGLFILLSLLLVSCKETTSDDPNMTSAYISEVFEYIYAPGQHAKLAKATDAANFVGEPNDAKGWLYLGGFGGYVIAGFNHNVTNGDGVDFEVYALSGASPEPAVVYVMSDTNGDGKPNDTWYELKGNQFENSKRNYWVRYYKATSDSSNIHWKDSDNKRGELIAYMKATAYWWWSSTATDSITLSGTRLPDAYDNLSTTDIPYWTVPTNRFILGYAENRDGTDFDSSIGANQLDISNAVDELGNAVNLSNIRFIKVQTAVFQQAGWLNEVSSEIRGAKDLRR